MHPQTVARLSAQVVALGCIVALFVVRIPRVSGSSMEPLLPPGGLVVIDTLAYRLHPPHRGDIVAIRRDDPVAPEVVKRIVGVAGDRLRIVDGIVWRDGRELTEPYVAFRDHTALTPLIVPAGCVFVLGDNRPGSDDSRDWGAVPDTTIVGEIVAGLVPPRWMPR